MPQLNNPSPGELLAHLNARFNELATERSAFDPIWKETASYLKPTRPRFFSTDVNKPRFNPKIMDGSPMQSKNISRSGMLAGMASSARPWFTLQSGNEGEQQSPQAEAWLELFRDKMLRVFDTSNFYTSLGTLFDDELTFGTAPMMILAHPIKIIRCQTFPIGSYSIAQSPEGIVDVIGREYTATVRQLHELYGDSLPQLVMDAYNSNRLESRVTIRHLILPNPMQNENALEAHIRLPWLEAYWVHTSSDSAGGDKPNFSGSTMAFSDGENLLALNGYEESPLITARWDRNDDDVYATSWPALDAIGDIKELQARVRRGSNAIGKMINPSLLADPSMRGKAVSLLEGAITYDGSMGGDGRGTRPLHDVGRFPLEHLEAGNEELRQRIARYFFADLFLMMFGDKRNQRATATEAQIMEREKLAVLGPVLERHSDDVFDPIIERVAALMIRRSEFHWAQGEDGLLPLPPEEIRGRPIRPQYVSEMAQAQKLVGINGLERHIGMVGNMAQFYPQALDVPDLDEAVREHADRLSIPSRLTRPAELVGAIRQSRAQEQAAAEQREQLPGMAKAAKDFSETDPDKAVDAASRVAAAAG